MFKERMSTLVELYDERPIENVLSTEMFRPAQTILMIPYEFKDDDAYQQKLQQYMKFRKIKNAYSFVVANMYDPEEVYEKLERIIQTYDDVTIDITGGTDAALFATGKICSKYDVAVITYSRRKNRFFSIQNADFADGKLCTVQYDVESFLRMAGGAMREGRVDNSILNHYFAQIEEFFQVYLKFRRQWLRTITYIQHASQPPANKEPTLYASGSRVIRTEQGKVSPSDDLLKAFEKIQFIHRLHLGENEISFEFHDYQIRTWLRDIGSVLELYVYKACVDAKIFQDVRCSVVVDWEGDGEQNNVTNEIDVMCARNVMPFFISCKTNQVKTEALNELSVIRDRFGGQMAYAAIVTTTKGSAIMKRRAMELKIHVIDLDILTKGELSQALISSSTMNDMQDYIDVDYVGS